MRSAATPLHTWAVRGLLALLLGGLAFGAYSAATSSRTIRSRTLVVLAPLNADVQMRSGPAPLTRTDGVHAFTVQPGPVELEIRQAEARVQTVSLTVPKGIGGLMIDLSYYANGDVTVGYF